MSTIKVREWNQSTVEFNHKIFKGAFSMIIVGKHNCGKTNIIFQMLLEPGFLDYESLYIFSPSIYQPKYQLLIKAFEAGLSKEEVNKLFEMQDEINKKREKENKPKITDPAELIELFTNNENFDPCENSIDVYAFQNIYELPKVEDVDKSKKNVFIFDDCATKKKTIIDTYFTRGRHSNIICIYITHRFHELPLIIRNNADYIMLFILTNQQPLQYIFSDYCSMDFEDLKSFKSYCNICWKKDYDFILIKVNEREKDNKFFKRFDIPFSQIT